jgi:hypothetical protein|tara:strand:+ start:220 stop:363 length:144 start_codon:yes stop_codon:yes gene_type:complete
MKILAGNAMILDEVWIILDVFFGHRSANLFLGGLFFYLLKKTDIILF